MENPAFYLDDYSDEIMPFGVEELSLDGWAKWLSKGGDPNWPADVPEDGQVLGASSISFDDDVIAQLGDDGETITFSRPLKGYAFAAVRFGPNMGWSPEDIIDPSDAENELLGKSEWRDEPMLEPGGDCLIAVGKTSNLRLRYIADGPALEILGAVQ
jgi:hypothetical protein